MKSDWKLIEQLNKKKKEMALVIGKYGLRIKQRDTTFDGNLLTTILFIRTI